MQIGGFKKLTLVDYPKHLACSVFLIGCNFRCPWCNPPQFILPMQTPPVASKKDFFRFLREKRKELDAVVIDGGEPTMHSMLPWFCKGIKKLGYKIKLNSNGSYPQMIEGLIKDKLIDFIELDIKAPKEKYSQLIGFEDCSVNYFLDQLEKSIKLVKASNLDHQFSTTWVPILTKADIKQIAGWIKPAKKYVLRGFKKTNLLNPEYMILKPYPKKEFYKMQKAIAPLFDVCEIK